MLVKSDFFIEFDPVAVTGAAAGFAWLDKKLARREFILVSVFGDLYFKDGSGKIRMLDMVEGKIHKLAKNEDELQKLFNAKEVQEQLLLSELLVELKEKGIVRKAGELFSFIKPVVSGGEIALQNVRVVEFREGMDLLAGIHRKAAGLA